MMEQKKFSDVFASFQFSENVLNALAESLVSDIQIDKNRGNMSVYLNIFKIIDETYLEKFKEEILLAHPFIKDLSVNHKYSLNGEESGIVSEYWDNILLNVGYKSQLCKRLLAVSKWNFSGGELNIETIKGGAFLIKSYGVDADIRNLLKSRLSIDANVMIMDNAPGKTKEEKQNVMESAIKQAVKESLVAAPKPNEFTMSQKTYSNGSKGEKFGGKRKPKTKRAESLTGVTSRLSDNIETGDEILFQGIIFNSEVKEAKTGTYIALFDVTDYSESISVKFFSTKEYFEKDFKDLIKTGEAVKVFGEVVLDDFSKEVLVMAKEIAKAEISESAARMDFAGEKRVELHLHSNMSQMDAINPITDYIKTANKWGHKAIAITDHGVVQAFPEAMNAAKKYGIKIIYGLEAYLVNDLASVVQLPYEKKLESSEYVVFDVETTGLKKDSCTIIEIGAVKIKDGVISESFSALINPNMPIPKEIVDLTGITDSMVMNEPAIDKVLPEFFNFISDSVLVAHNAPFDMGFITNEGRKLGLSLNNTVLCTLALSRIIFPELKRHKLNIVAEHLGVSLENHHRAVDDARATAEVFLRCIEILKERDIVYLRDINLLSIESENVKKLNSYHAIILAKNLTGLKNLYKLVSDSHINYFYKRPRIPKSEIIKNREGLILGTACEAGELYQAVLNNLPKEVIDELAGFYDYFEIQPCENNMFMIRDNIVSSVSALEDINKKIVNYGEVYKKPVVATCDVHFLDPESEIYRKIIMAGEGFKDTDHTLPLYLRTTEEMLEKFAYLGNEKAYEVVVSNTNVIADSCENIKPIPDGTHPPEIAGSEEKIKEITMKMAKDIYGDPLPLTVMERLERELHSIIKNGFSVMYIIAQKLVSKSMEDGYLVGSRGSVGSSLVATMAGITEVNPLPPHYYCKKCQYSDFDSELVKSYSAGAGYDMPDRICPKCGALLKKDGHNIPFETFLGFDGDKEPDIDLNFSGEYQAKAHAYTEELFGKGYVFKAGTIGTLADKTAYGYVSKYFEEKGIIKRKAEIGRLSQGLTGIKRTTGQHPGGLVILPKGKEIYEFCPIQRPANDMKTEVTTTHFDFHSIEGRLLKLDILGHDVPTIIRMLHDITGIDPREVDLGDKDVMSLFTSPRALGVTEEELGIKTGTLGLPEFGTNFVRQMLTETKPEYFSDLVRISGLSHGTEVWNNNAQNLIKEGTATLKEVIPTRDDIMVYLINKGVEKKAAFKIMESVRKGKGLNEAEEKSLRDAKVPAWYIESCKKISYLFPKGHAVAYVMMTVRIGYYKIHHPYSFYAAGFSVKSADFDYDTMCKGIDVARNEMRRIFALGKEATAKEQSSLTVLELCCEMYLRRLKFVSLDLYKSDATKFIVTKDGLLPPLCSVAGLGENAAKSIVIAREEEEFISVQDFKERAKVTKTVIELLRQNNILKALPETNQLSLFQLID